MANIARGVDPYVAGISESASGAEARTDIGKYDLRVFLYD